MLLWFATSAALFFVLTLAFEMYWVLSLILSLNVITFLCFGLDKTLAISRTRRIPEKVLWFTAFAGGPVGAILGMQFFRHKISKKSFQFGLAVVVLMEIAIVALLLDRAGIGIRTLSS